MRLLFPILFLVLMVMIAVAIGSSLKTEKAKKAFALLLSIVLITIVGIVFLQVYLHSNPGYVFQDTFGFEAPVQISNIQGEISSAFDLSETWVSFNSTQEVVDAIIERKGFIEINRDEAIRDRFMEIQGAPFSWPNNISTEGKFYRSWREKNEILIYDQPNRKVYFHSSKLQ
jgi:hypothetical protein